MAPAIEPRKPRFALVIVTQLLHLTLASASAAPFFMLKVEPSEDALLVPTLSSEALTTHLTTIAQGHILLLGICVVNILLMITEPPRTIVKPKRA